MPLLSSTLARRTLAFMLAAMLALLAIVLTSVWLASRTADHADEVFNAREIRTLAATMLAALLDAETGQRGFLLTENGRYLEPYERAKVLLGGDIQRLKALVAGDKADTGRAARLGELIAAKLRELAETIDLANAGNREAALAIVGSDRGLAVMQETRSVLAALTAQAEGRVNARLIDLNRAARTLIWMTLAGGALIVAFAGAAFWTVARYTRELVGARQQVETLNQGLEERVAERTAALSQANDEIQRFAYIVSHDLRAPLVNIMGFTSELEVGTASLQKFVAAEQPDASLVAAARTAAEEDLPEAVRFIRASTAKMDRLINAILKLSREGRRELKPRRIELGPLLANAAASVQHQVDNAGARIELAGKFPAVTSDRLALEQVFGNLIDNAVKYLSPDRPGLITIGATETRQRVAITVSDNGRGIDAKDHERIFELFRRAGAQNQPGEGIGLAHVRALVRRLGGDITLQSRLGEGARFTIDLPKTPTTNESYPLS